MFTRIFMFGMICSLTILSILFASKLNINRYLNSVFIRERFLMNVSDYRRHETNTLSIHPMLKDPEAKQCYSLKSFSMPEEIINVDSVVISRKTINLSEAPKEVTFDRVHSLLYGDPTLKSIYFNAKKYFNKSVDASYPHTSMSGEIFQKIIQKVHPSLKIQFGVEVGSFTGNSAVRMGRVLKKNYSNAFLLCIDTWLGDLNMWVNKAVWKHLSVSEDGRPTVFYQFLANIIANNLTRTILPVSMSSIIGARFLRTFAFRPQLIYLDSAHEQGETLIELTLYWRVLEPGGVLFGDDWSWISVRCDVKKFSYMHNITIDHFGGTWVLRKPLVAS